MVFPLLLLSGFGGGALFSLFKFYCFVCLCFGLVFGILSCVTVSSQTEAFHSAGKLLTERLTTQNSSGRPRNSPDSLVPFRPSKTEKLENPS